jgi:hypothetical protein
VNMQFLSDYLPLSPAGGAAATDWPATVNFFIYSAGTYVRGDGGTLDLGVVRDSVQNETNDFTLMWTEQFISTCKVGYESRLYAVAAAACGVTACCA